MKCLRALTLLAILVTTKNALSEGNQFSGGGERDNFSQEELKRAYISVRQKGRSASFDAAKIEVNLVHTVLVGRILSVRKLKNGEFKACPKMDFLSFPESGKTIKSQLSDVERGSGIRDDFGKVVFGHEKHSNGRESLKIDHFRKGIRVSTRWYDMETGLLEKTVIFDREGNVLLYKAYLKIESPPKGNWECLTEKPKYFRNVSIPNPSGGKIGVEKLDSFFLATAERGFDLPKSD